MRFLQVPTSGCVAATLLCLGCVTLFGQTPATPEPLPQAVDETVPPLSNNYALGPDSLPQPGVPVGKAFRFDVKDSKIFPGTSRTISVFVPAAYTGEKPACVFVFLDGIGFKAETVFDNLIAKHEMPVTIAVGISPGQVDASGTAANPRFDRSLEFDSMTDRLARFVLEEVLPEVARHPTPDGKPIVLSQNPDDRAVAGGSTGGIGSFNLAWQRPDAFHRVFTSIGTFVGMRGGERYYVLVRKTEPKPLRIFMEDGVHDEWGGGPEVGDWWMSNLTMERALEFAGYDLNHAWGAGNHNGQHATALFPDAMRWLWRDWPTPIRARESGNLFLKSILQPGEGWKAVGSATPGVPSLVVDLQGNLLPGGAALAVGPDGRRYGAQEVVGLSARNMTVRNNGDLYLTTRDNALWRVRANGERTKLDDALKAPSGLAFSPDGLWLFVAQEGSRWGLNYRVLPDGTVDSREPLYDFWVPDWADDSGAVQVCMDREGRAYVATRAGVQVFDRNGRVRAILPLPGNEEATGVCFGGAQFDTLYVSGGGKIYGRKLHSVGALPWAAPIELPKWGAG